MGVVIPYLAAETFHHRLEVASGVRLGSASREALYAHFQELRRWSPSLALLGPGTVESLVERHYGESLAALELLEGERGALLDLGSGAGFPGFVLAAVCPDLEVWLVEARQRKCAFLAAAARRAGVWCRPLPIRIATPLPGDLPGEINFLTLRAMKLAPALWMALVGRLRAPGRALWWVGKEDPELPEGMAVEAIVPLPMSGERRILVLQRQSQRSKDRGPVQR